MLKSNIFDFSYIYILVKGTITVGANAKSVLERNNKQLIFKNCTSSSDCVSDTINA